MTYISTGIRLPLLKSPLRVLQCLRSNSSSQNRWLQRSRTDVYSREAKLKNLRSRAAFKLMEIDDKYHLFDKTKPQAVLDLGFAPGSWSQVARMRTNPKAVIMGVDILPCRPLEGVHAIQANILSRNTHNMIRLFFNEQFHLNVTDEVDPERGYFNREYMDTDSSKDKSASLTDVSEILPVDVVMSDMYVPLPRDFSSANLSSNITNMPYYRLMNTSGVAVRDHLRSVDLCDAALVTAIDLLKPGGTFVCKLYTGKEEQLFKKRLRKVFSRVHMFKPQSSRSMSKEVYYIGQGKRHPIDKVDVFTA